MPCLDGLGSCGVLVVGEFGGDDSLQSFSPSGRSGAVLQRAINRIGCRREMFWLLETDNYEHMRQMANELHPRAVLALGDKALAAMTGLAGDKLSCKHLTGYVLPSVTAGGAPVVPMFHPKLLRGGHMSLFGVLMRTLRLAIQVAKESRQPTLPDLDTPPAGYQMWPTEANASTFADAALLASTEEVGYLAYDIETNYSNSEEDAEERFDAIRSIQFSYAPGSGIFMPWREPFIAIAKRLLASQLSKIGWNNWRFDDPLLRDNQCEIGGRNFDLMWMWHHIQPDLPRGLQFAAAMQGPQIYTPSHSWPFPWKHLDHQLPQYYGIVDVDVLQWMVSYAI